MPDVVVGSALGQPGPQPQDRYGPIQYLRFLVDAQHNRLVRRVHIQLDHIADLRVQLRVGGELQRLPPPRLPASDRRPYLPAQAGSRLLRLVGALTLVPEGMVRDVELVIGAPTQLFHLTRCKAVASPIPMK
jgi:hypothetical protein